MKSTLSTPQGLATATGGAILFAATNANILQTGGWVSSHAMLVTALSLGVFAGARVAATAPGKVGLAIVAALVAGEAYNFSATAERIVIEREASAAPLRDLAVKRTAALASLKKLETGTTSTLRLEVARVALADAKAAVEAEARDIRCGKECVRKQGLADKAAEEVKAAAAEAETLHVAAIDAAKAEVAANPVPVSATPLADRLGWAPWALDLLVAGALSLGANGLAAVLLAFGAPKSEIPAKLSVPTIPEKQIPGNNPPNGGRRGRKSDPKILNFSEAFRKAHGRAPTGSEVKAYFPELPTSTAYDYAARARA